MISVRENTLSFLSHVKIFCNDTSVIVIRTKLVDTVLKRCLNVNVEIPDSNSSLDLLYKNKTRKNMSRKKINKNKMVRRLKFFINWLSISVS